MVEFLQENLGSMVGMVVMVCMLILIHLLSSKSDVDALDKKRIAKGMATMTEDEKQLANHAIRKTILSVSTTVLIAYFVSLAVGYFFEQYKHFRIYNMKKLAS